MVTAILTSCNRPKLLEVTLESFFKFNTYPLERFIVIDDSLTRCNDYLAEKYPQIEFIYNPVKLGQWASLDRVMAMVTTPYVFGMEEDWRFYQYGFIEKSLALMEAYPHYVTCWLRSQTEPKETLHHRPEPKLINEPIPHKLMATDHAGIWSGFTFNPGLRRVIDYKKLGIYSQYHEPNKPYAAEGNISAMYKHLGYRAAIFEEGFVEHIGWQSHVVKPTEIKTLAIIIPYRDRQQHLNKFIPHIRQYLAKTGIKNYTLNIIEQSDNKPFNRAKLLNIGASLVNAHYYVFHDVDMLPVDVDYSYTTLPCHLANKCSQFGYQMPYAEYFGGVTMLTRDLFFHINGFSNEFWGWGAEDDDLRNRVLKTDIPIWNRPGKFESQHHAPSVNSNLKANQKLLKSNPKDGLSDLKYNLISDTNSGHRHIRVAL